MFATVRAELFDKALLSVAEGLRKARSKLSGLSTVRQAHDSRRTALILHGAGSIGIPHIDFDPVDF